jgi:hypothetical protein
LVGVDARETTVLFDVDGRSARRWIAVCDRTTRPLLTMGESVPPSPTCPSSRDRETDGVDDDRETVDDDDPEAPRTVA